MARRSVEVRREEILSATVGEVQRRGLAHTRVADVATVLGISSALIHYHFGTKDRLLAEAFAFAAQRDLDRLERVLARRSDPLRRLRDVLRLYAPTGASPGWVLWVDAWAEALRSPELRAVSQRLDLRWKDAVAAVITEGVRAGQFDCTDPQATAWRLTAMLDGLAVQTTVHRGVLSRAQSARWVAEHAAHELGLPPGALDGGR